MGVVFGLFSAFYYWIDFFVGLKYSDYLGRLHFWLTFVGVNLTFFPMHFLGLAGMPRRIPDYPDVYWSWNYISSVGSLVSVIGVFVFFCLVLDIILTNSLYLQNKNNYYIIALNSLFTKYEKQVGFSLSKNIFTFKKYNFYDVMVLDSIYLSIDNLLLSQYLIDIKSVDSTYITNKDLEKNLFKVWHGWVFIGLFFIYIPGKKGYNLIKLNYYNLILNKFIYKFMPSNLFKILKNLIIQESRLLSKDKYNK